MNVNRLQIWHYQSMYILPNIKNTQNSTQRLSLYFYMSFYLRQCVFWFLFVSVFCFIDYFRSIIERDSKHKACVWSDRVMIICLGNVSGSLPRSRSDPGPNQGYGKG